MRVEASRKRSLRLRSVAAVRRSGGPTTCHVFRPEDGAELLHLIATNTGEFELWTLRRKREGSETQTLEPFQ